MAARRRPGDHPEPAGDHRDGDAERLRRPDRVVLPPADPARAHHDQPAPAQRPRHRRRRDRAGDDGRRRPGRGLPVRARRAHRQRLPGHPRHEPLQPGHRPADRLQRHRRDPPHGRVLHPAAGPPAAPLRRRPGLHGVLRLPPGRDQEGARGPRPPGRRAGRPGRRAGLGGAVPADRPEGRRPHLRGRDPGQQPVRQGRRGLHPQGRAQARPAAPRPDRVQPGRSRSTPTPRAAR